MEEQIIIEFNGENYEIIDTFSRSEGKLMYIAMQLVDSGDDEPSIEIYRFTETEDGLYIFPTETDLEYEKAAELFAALQEE